MRDRFRVRVWDIYGKRYMYEYQSNPDYAEIIDDPNYIFEQCTGLKDKYGNLIYEGDILQSTDGFFHQKYKVKWDREFSQFTLIGINTINTAFGIIAPDSLKIIGNIHENPELLEEK